MLSAVPSFSGSPGSPTLLRSPKQQPKSQINHAAAKTYCDNGILIMESNLFQCAITAFQEALEVQPNCPLAKTLLSYCWNQVDSRFSFESENADPEALYRIGCLYKSNEPNEAAKWFRKSASKGYTPANEELERIIPLQFH